VPDAGAKSIDGSRFRGMENPIYPGTLTPGQVLV